VQAQILHVGGAGVGGAHQHQHPRADPSRCLHEGVDGVGAHQRVHRGHVDAETRQAAERRRRAVQQRAGICARGHVDVTALAVGDHEQAQFARVPGHVFQRRPPGGAEQLEARKLGLDRDARVRGGVDEGKAVCAHSARSRAHGIGDIRGCCGRRGPQRRRVGIEAEDDLRLARGDPRRQGVPEGGRAVQRPFTALFRPLPAVNRGTREAAISMRSPVRGFTPARALRSLTWNLPKPDTVTSLPLRSASSTVASTASTALEASLRVSWARSATCSTSSDFVTSPSSLVRSSLRR
jgi:hypothetical protein